MHFAERLLSGDRLTAGATPAESHNQGSLALSDFSSDILGTTHLSLDHTACRYKQTRGTASLIRQPRGVDIFVFESLFR